MSEAYANEAALVGAESNLYDRALDAAIALTVLSFLLGLLTLVKVVGLETAGGALADVFVWLTALGVGAVGIVAVANALGVVRVTSTRVRGIGVGLVVGLVVMAAIGTVLDVTLATLLGLVLLVEAGVVLGAGVASHQGVVDTEPSATPGLLAGGAFAIVGAIIGAALGGTFLSGLPFAFVGSALVGGLGLAAATILPREDLGSSLPVALLVGLLGLVVVTGTIDAGWTWSPGQTIDGDLTGGVVIPLFALLGSIVAGWGAAKARAGYGARGRQYGAFLTIYLNAILTVAVMVSIVAFVTMQGITYAVHGFSIGAVSALVLLTPALALALDWARTPAGTDDWHSGARQFLRVTPLAALGALVGLLGVVLVTGEAFEIPFTYTVWVNRSPEVLDTAVRVTPATTVGNLVLAVPGVFLVWFFLRRYGSLRGVGTVDDRVSTVERGVGLAAGLVALLVAVRVLPLPETVAVVPVWPLDALAGALALPFVWLAALATGGLVALALGSLLVGDGALAERAVERAQRVRVGLFGALVFLASALFLALAGGVNPSVGPANLVPVVAVLGAVVAVAVSSLTWLGRRAVADPDVTRICRKEGALAMAVAAGFVVVAALHVALRGVSFSMGPVTIDHGGTLSWPMAMEAYIPLGAEPGGIMPAVVGTVWLVVGAALFAVPLGVGAAVFLTEYAEQGRVTSVVEIATNALWSTPSIVFGLFGAAFLIPRLGGDESLMAGMLVLGFMLLPLVLITSREAIKSVPDQYRDASAALGVSQWETIKSVVVPASMPGVITGVILGVGRVAGETAPLILVLGSTLNATEAIDVLGGFQFTGTPPFVYNPTLLEASSALPTQVWAVIAAGVSGSPSMGWASALLLLMVVLSFYAVGIVARTYFRRKLDYE